MGISIKCKARCHQLTIKRAGQRHVSGSQAVLGPVAESEDGHWAGLDCCRYATDPVTVAPANPLIGVPYYRQRDSAQLSQRDRTCFSSSCAMLLEALKPGTLHGPNGDDQYLATVQRFGDTTQAAAQIQALAHYGITARFEQSADFLTIEQQIARGIPVPCGYLHRGPVHRPTGGGHWAIVYGHTRNSVIVNDPWGDPDLITGETISPNGKELQFSRERFGRRWMVRSIGNRAYRFEPGNGWAIIADQAR